MKSHGPWKIAATHEVYRDPWIEVRQDDVIRPDGRPGTHCVVQMKPGISVLPIDAEENVYLTQEFHYGQGCEGIEVVSGGIEPGEGASETAQRELEEELGIRAARLTPLGTINPFTTIIVSPSTLFLAEELSFVPTALEGTELIRRVKLPLAEAVAMALDGRITHGPSCVLILKAHILRAGTQA